MPALFVRLAQRAAFDAGFQGFTPDACLINRYEPGTRLSLHQDRNERDFAAPIVSVSLGLPATFLFGGALGGLAGAQLGKALASRGDRLTAIFANMIFAVAGYMIARTT